VNIVRYSDVFAEFNPGTKNIKIEFRPEFPSILIQKRAENEEKGPKV